MRPNNAARIMESSGVVASGAFGISNKDSAHIMGILRDTLYSDKFLAVLREYSTNAWDAHKDAGKADVPIQVTLPTFTDPTLRIRDFGLGLTQEAVFEVYTQYGASTKRNSDSVVGMLGIGSKSGFSYSDSFGITSFNGGMKRVYVAALDKSEKGVINLLHEEPSEETGVLIEMAVRPDDIPEFERRAKSLFKYFKPRPNVNAVIPELPPTQKELTHGVIYTRADQDDDSYYPQHGWVAVMGCVSYKINLDQIRNFEEGISEFLFSMSGALYFGIGDVQISASREELKYSDMTKSALKHKFNALVDEFVKHTLDSIESENLSPWAKRVRYKDLVKMHLPIPSALKDLTEEAINIEGKIPKSCRIVNESAKRRKGEDAPILRSIPVGDNIRFVIRDDHRALKGYELDWGVILVHRSDKVTPWETVQADLEAMLKDIGCEGMSIQRCSQMQWVAPVVYHAEGTADKAKHRTNAFKYNPEESKLPPLSDCWDVESRVPQETDVFVLLYRFKTDEFGLDFYIAYDNDRDLATGLGAEMPVIYGYKGKRGTDHKSFTGTYYPEWRKTFFKSLVTDEVKAWFENMHWSRVCPNLDLRRRDLKPVIKQLGRKHHLVEMLRKHIESKEVIKKLGNDKLGAIRDLYERVKDANSPPTAQAEFDAAVKKYPLFNIEGFNLGDLWGRHGDKWLHYIRLIDGVGPTVEEDDDNESTSVHPDE